VDYWCCLKGSFKVGLAKPIDEEKLIYEVEWEYLSEKEPRVLKIDVGTYHGYMALQPDSIMLYYLTEIYDPEDEVKVPINYFGEEWRVKSK
jgi:dTDP-4-dehydrorhamnose 3,5-epimerase-like enzyme